MSTARREWLRSCGPYLAGAIAILLLGAVGTPRLRGLLLNSGRLTLGTLAISVPLGGLLGIAIAKTDLPGRRWTIGLLLGLLFVPLYVHAAAWQTALGDGGWVAILFTQRQSRGPLLDGWFGAIWVHGMAATSWITLLAAASLRSVERQLEEQSLLSMTSTQVLLRVSLRRGMAGVLIGAIWTTIVCCSEIAVTDLFGIRTFAEEIYTEASLGSLSGGPSTASSVAAIDGDPGVGFRPTDLAIGVSILLVLVLLGLRLAAAWLPSVLTSTTAAVWKWSPLRGRGLFTAAFASIVAIVVLVPMASLVWKAGLNIEPVGGELRRDWSARKLVKIVAGSFVEHRREWLLSLSIGLSVAAVAIVGGTVAVWIGRSSRVARWVVAGATAAALALPAPLVGVWAIRTLNHPSDTALSWLTWLYDRTFFAPAAVQCVRAMPFAMMILWAQLAATPQELLDAAASDGAGPWRQLLRVALPIRWPGVVAAGAVAVVAAMGELSATLLVYPPGVTPLSVRVFQLLHYGVDDRVAALSLAVWLSICGLTSAFVIAAKFAVARDSLE